MHDNLKNTATVQELATSVSQGDIRTCARLISQLENGDRSIKPVIRALFKTAGHTPILGITGPPGSGKSTLVDKLVSRFRQAGKRVAVLAVDPSSPLSGGAILGDRVRMNRHNTDSGVFIRSMSSRGRLGGLSQATGEALVILDNMGMDVILLETVGVGQNEVDIMRHAQTVLILQTPAGGDGIQAVKAGILEIGDLFAVNKADTPNADIMAGRLQEAVQQRYREHDSDTWIPPVIKIQADNGDGVEALIALFESHQAHLKNHPEALREKQKKQVNDQLHELVNEGFRSYYARFMEQDEPFEALVENVLDRETDPYSAAEIILQKIGVGKPV